MAQTTGNGANRTPALLAAGAAAALGAAASYYFYFSKNARQNRRRVIARAQGVRDAVADQAERLKKLNRTQVLAAVDAVAAGYERVRGIDPSDVRAAVKELRSNWRKLADDIGKEITRGRASKATKRRSGKRR